MAYSQVPAHFARLIEVGEARINVVDVGDEGGTPVVFLHGGGPGCTGWNDWHAVGESLGEKHRRIYVDFPYYGGSSATRVHGPMFSAMADIVAGVAEALGLKRFHLVCQSFGGGGAIVLATRRPEMVMSLALTGVGVEYGVGAPYMAERVLKHFLFPMYAPRPTRDQMKTLLEVTEWYDPQLISDDLVDARFELAGSDQAIERFTDFGVLGDPEALAPYLPMNTVPTLLAYGDADPFVAADVPVHLFNAFPNSRLVMVKHASHHFPEEMPETYLSVIRPWFDECESRLAVGAENS